MTRNRSRQAETEDINPRRLKRGAVKRTHVDRWAIGRNELAPGVVGDTHLGPRVVNETHIHPNTYANLRGSAQLLVMSATADEIDTGGDYVTFGSVVARHGFTTTTAAGDSWTHPVGGVYTLTYEHAWDSYEGGGTIALEIDGQVSSANVLASGGDGARVGRATIHYVAAAGSVGKIKVTHDSGSARTCSGTVWISLPDPTEATPAGSADVILFVDGVQVASASGDIGASFSAATMLLGVTADDPAAASDYHFDQAEVMRDGVNLLSNAGFESALAGSGATKPSTTANWWAYVQGTSTVARVASPVHAGSQALRVNVAGAANQGSFAFQDIASLAPGEVFEIGSMVRPSGSGLQTVGLLFDWDHAAAASQFAIVEMTSAATSFSAFGLSGSAGALPAGEWSEVVLRVGVTA